VRGGRLFIGLSTRLGDTADDGVAGKGSPFARAFSANIQMPGRVGGKLVETRETGRVLQGEFLS
jgi:hypothetical protein